MLLVASPVLSYEILCHNSSAIFVCVWGKFNFKVVGDWSRIVIVLFCLRFVFVQSVYDATSCALSVCYWIAGTNYIYTNECIILCQDPVLISQTLITLTECCVLENIFMYLNDTFGFACYSVVSHLIGETRERTIHAFFLLILKGNSHHI